MGFVSTQRLVQRGPPPSASPTLLPSQTAEEKKKKPWVNKLSSIHCREGNATVVFMKRKYILGWGKSMQPPTMRMMLICLFFFKVSRHFSFTLEIIVCFYNPPGLTLLSLESSANCSPCVISFEPSDSGNQVCFEWLQWRFECRQIPALLVVMVPLLGAPDCRKSKIGFIDAKYTEWMKEWMILNLVTVQLSPAVIWKILLICAKSSIPEISYFGDNICVEFKKKIILRVFLWSTWGMLLILVASGCFWHIFKNLQASWLKLLAVTPEIIINIISFFLWHVIFSLSSRPNRPTTLAIGNLRL